MSLEPSNQGHNQGNLRFSSPYQTLLNRDPIMVLKTVIVVAMGAFHFHPRLSSWLNRLSYHPPTYSHLHVVLPF